MLLLKYLSIEVMEEVPKCFAGRIILKSRE